MAAEVDALAATALAARLVCTIGAESRGISYGGYRGLTFSDRRVFWRRGTRLRGRCCALGFDDEPGACVELASSARERGNMPAGPTRATMSWQSAELDPCRSLSGDVNARVSCS